MTPVLTSMLAAFGFAMPCPFTPAKGSVLPITTGFI